MRPAGVHEWCYQTPPFSEYCTFCTNKSNQRRIIQSQSPFTMKHNDVLPVKVQKGLWEQLWARVWTVYDLIDCVVIVKDSVPSACGTLSRHSSSRLFPLALINFTSRAELYWDLKQLPYWWMPTYERKRGFTRANTLGPADFAAYVSLTYIFI